MGSPEHAGQDNGCRGSSSPSKQHSPPPPLPSAPNPAADPGVVPSISSPPEDDGKIPPDELDVFVLSPIAALKMLCNSVDALVRFTGDVPPTPPVSRENHPHYQSMEVGAEGSKAQDGNEKENDGGGTPDTRKTSDHIDGVPFVKTPMGSPEAHPSEPLHVIGADTEPVSVQHLAIARKFYSKKPPPISLEEYLMRLHRYCPMSTAVYLATSLYINRLAVIERTIPVTPRNVHRLLLAGLRVAMKALEDLSYPHRRFAKVGGVSEVELGRLEITFCFLIDFELKVDAEMLLKEATSLRDGAAVVDAPAAFEPKMPPMSSKRKSSSIHHAMPSRPMAVDVPTPS